MSYIFLSFASADAELAHRALGALERAGIPCWIADRDIEVSTSYPAAIGAAITNSAGVLLLLTETSNASPHVLREVELAFNARKPIAPVRLARVTPSADLQYFLSTSQWLDAGTAFDDQDIAKIEPVLREVLAGRHGQFAATVTSRRALWLSIAATLVVAVALVAILLPRKSREAAATPDAAAQPAPAANNATGASPAATPAPNMPSAATGGPKTQVNPRDGLVYVWIPPGHLVMGCSDGDPSCEADEKPAHAVEIARGFWLARTEATNAAYRKVDGPVSGHNAAEADLPAVGIDWPQARAYCTRIGGRLPTEAEWEYAARGGTSTRYYGTLTAIAWYADNSDDRTHPVGMKQPNAFGLYDMLGNVSEWVLDRYYNAYDDTSDPSHPDLPLAGNASAVVRGGSWVSGAEGVRVSRRLETAPDTQEPQIGVRCASDRL
ncbi:MAG TPA: SUMF1/EgtB/PvdO family nonheme iron enzyme [Vicinamibacterales bacterium]|nr:SUMF1/EgtB/PvdO family nonheme iron enzyme [Vicinamibacterales bacterium]